ncbi:MAG: hypothetical protein HY906_24085, partial [Deltaproteobacteria bacterium]|nr:hypothetical protein [Deltaproteobacteria bacterium]
MLTRTHLSPLPLVAALLALAAVSGCADPRYCDVGKPCSDPAYPYCDLVRHECEATAPADGGVDASVDAPQRDGGDGPVASDGGDAGGDDAGDAGCTSPAHWCSGGGCVPNDVDHCGESCEQCTAPTNGHPTCDGTSCSFACDASYYLNSTTCDPCDVPAHCGPTCATCGGDRPDCSGHAGKCVCNGTSCSGTTPVCDSNTGACRGCQAHAECASGACDPSGGCVAADQIIYLDKNNASCTDSGGTAGEPGTPFCTFPPALTKALGGAGYLVVRPGTYSFTADTYVTNGTVVIIGSDPATTELVQTKNNRAVLKLVDASNVTLEGLTLRGAFGNDGHGVWCAGQSSAVGTLTVRRCVLQGNVLRGID